jgi:hypothetical protein
MAANTPGINAVDRLLLLLDQLAEVIEEVRQEVRDQAKTKEDDGARPNC